MTPVYPKEDPEYRKRVMEKLYKKVRETKWTEPDERPSKPRGRKAKVIERPEAKPRESEKYNWFK